MKAHDSEVSCLPCRVGEGFPPSWDVASTTPTPEHLGRERVCFLPTEIRKKPVES